jgi:hypothetical protein
LPNFLVLLPSHLFQYFIPQVCALPRVASALITFDQNSNDQHLGDDDGEGSHSSGNGSASGSASHRAGLLLLSQAKAIEALMPSVNQYTRKHA